MVHNGSIFSKEVEEVGVTILHGIVVGKYFHSFATLSLNYVGKDTIDFW